MITLPAELLLRIFSQFDVRCSTDEANFPAPSADYQQLRRTLCSLCLVCRCFRELSQAMLYREVLFVYTSPGPDGSPDSAIRKWNTPFNSFMRTMKERRDLAANVRHVAFYAAAAHRIRDNPWVAIALVAFTLPNLDHCFLDFGPTPKHLIHPLGPGQRYRTPIDHYADPSPNSSAKHSFRLLNNDAVTPPSKVNLRTLNIRWPNGSTRYARTPPPTLRIETLRFAPSRIAPVNLEILLSRYFGLRTFVYEADRPFAIDLDLTRYTRHVDFQFDPFTAGRYLAHHQETLETLHLDLRYGNYYPHPPKSISGLENFTSLKTLLIDWTAVCSGREDPLAHRRRLAQMLPRSLVSLELVGCPGQALPLFAEMFLVLAEEIRQGQFAALRQVKCDARDIFRPEDHACFHDRAVVEEFAQLGVDFTYDFPPLDNRTTDWSYWSHPMHYQQIGPPDDRPWTALWDFTPMTIPDDPDYDDL